MLYRIGTDFLCQYQPFLARLVKLSAAPFDLRPKEGRILKQHFHVESDARSSPSSLRFTGSVSGSLSKTVHLCTDLFNWTAILGSFKTKTPS